MDAPIFLALAASTGRAALVVRGSDHNMIGCFFFNDMSLRLFIEDPPPPSIIGNEGLTI